MAWAKFDDQYPHHPKMIEGGRLEAIGLDVAGICYCNRHLTDGFVSDKALSLLFPPARNVKKLAQLLVDVGRWHRDDERKGYTIHDFLEYNPSRDEVEETRQKKAEAGRRGGKRSGKVRGSKVEAGASGLLEAESNHAELNPRPDPTRTRSPQGDVGTPPPPTRVRQLTIGGGGGDIETARQLIADAGIPEDIAEEAISKARIRAVDGGVSSFPAYALKRAETLMAERAETHVDDTVRHRRAARNEAQAQGEFDGDCDHGDFTTCEHSDCLDLKAAIIDRYQHPAGSMR